MYVNKPGRMKMKFKAAVSDAFHDQFNNGNDIFSRPYGATNQTYAYPKLWRIILPYDNKETLQQQKQKQLQKQ